MILRDIWRIAFASLLELVSTVCVTLFWVGKGEINEERNWKFN